MSYTHLPDFRGRACVTKSSPLWLQEGLDLICYNESIGALAERLRGGLQNLRDGFDSRTCLHEIVLKDFEAIFVLKFLTTQEKSDLRSVRDL